MSSQPTTISDPSQNSSDQKSNKDIIIALTVLFGTGVVCIACACYVNIRRRNRALQECTHMSQPTSTDVEAQQTNVDMSERSRHGRSRRYFPGFQQDDGGVSQTTLTRAAAQSLRSGSALDRRCSMNSSMMSDYGRSPAGSTFGTQVHGLRTNENDQEEDEEEHMDPPPRYEMAVREPPAVHLDAVSTTNGNTTPTVIGHIGGAASLVTRNEEDDDLYRSPTPPVESPTRTNR